MAQGDVIGAPPILTPPAGYLGFLGIKSGGRQPSGVAGFVQPSLDMQSFYRAGLRTQLFRTGAVAAGANGVDVNIATVPQGKVWLVECYTLVPTALGVAANLSPWAWIADPAGNMIYVSAPPARLSLTGEAPIVNIQGPMICLPGTVFRAYATAAAAYTAFNWFGNAVGIEVAA